MKKTLIKMVQYNKLANALLLKLLDTLSSEERLKDRGSHYKSLDELFAHIVGGSIFFMEAIGQIAPQIQKKFYDIEKLSVEELIALAPEMDQFAIDFIRNVSEEALNQEVDLFGKPTEAVDAFIIWARHGDHHRGQMSQILDEMNIKHDLILLES